MTGYLSDLIGKRVTIMCPMLFMASLILISVKLFIGPEPIYYYFCIFGIGIFLGGPYTILSSAISIDLSEKKEIKGNKAALVSISGFIEGTGALAAAVL